MKAINLTPAQLRALGALEGQYQAARECPTAYSPSLTAGFGLREATLRVLVRLGLANVRLGSCIAKFEYILADVDQDEMARVTTERHAYWERCYGASR